VDKPSQVSRLQKIKEDDQEMGGSSQRPCRGKILSLMMQVRRDSQRLCLSKTLKETSEAEMGEARNL